MVFFGIRTPGIAVGCEEEEDVGLTLYDFQGSGWDRSEARWVLRVDDHTFDFADADEVDHSGNHWCGVTADDLGWAAGDTSQVRITPSAGTPIAVPDGHSVIWRTDPTLGSGSDSEGCFADSWGLLTGPVTFEYKDGTYEAVAVRVPAVLDGEAYREFRRFAGTAGRAVEGDLDVALLEIEHPLLRDLRRRPGGNDRPRDSSRQARESRRGRAGPAAPSFPHPFPHAARHRPRFLRLESPTGRQESAVRPLRQNIRHRRSDLTRAKTADHTSRK